MYDIRADLKKNRLYLRLEGQMNEDEVKKAADKTIEESKKLKPGFDVINDISTFKPATTEGADEIKRAQAFIASRKPHRVVRIVKELISKMQFKRTSKDIYTAVEVTSLKEAEDYLDKNE